MQDKISNTPHFLPIWKLKFRKFIKFILIYQKSNKSRKLKKYKIVLFYLELNCDTSKLWPLLLVSDINNLSVTISAISLGSSGLNSSWIKLEAVQRIKVDPQKYADPRIRIQAGKYQQNLFLVKEISKLWLVLELNRFKLRHGFWVVKN